MYLRQFALSFFCGLFISIGCLSARAQSDKVIEDVQTAGNRRMTSEEVLSYIRTRPGQAYDQKQIESDLKTLRSLGIYNPSGVRVTMETGQRGGVLVIFQVQELPLIKALSFKDLPGKLEEELRELLRQKPIGIAEGQAAQWERLLRANEIIVKFLSRNGWSNVKAAFQYSDVSATEVLIEFVITGQRPVIYLKID